MSFSVIARPTARHRAVDEVARLRYLLDKARAGNAELRRRLAEATTARDAANAKASQLRDAQLRAAEATQTIADRDAEIVALKSALANAAPISDRPARAAVTETQPIPVVKSTPVWPLGEAAARGLL